MGRSRIYPNPENGTLENLKETSRVGSSETAQRCAAIQLLLSGVSREAVCQALIITERAIRKWVKAFNEKGIDGIIAKKRPGRTAIINGDKAQELSKFIEQPETANRTFWTAKAFHGYIGKTYQVECSYQTVVRFFHDQGFALKMPQPCPDRQDEEQRRKFIQWLKETCENDQMGPCITSLCHQSLGFCASNFLLSSGRALFISPRDCKNR